MAVARRAGMVVILAIVASIGGVIATFTEYLVWENYRKRGRAQITHIPVTEPAPKKRVQATGGSA